MMMLQICCGRTRQFKKVGTWYCQGMFIHTRNEQKAKSMYWRYLVSVVSCIYVYVYLNLEFFFLIGKFLSPLGLVPETSHKPCLPLYHLSQASRPSLILNCILIEMIDDGLGFTGHSRIIQTPYESLHGSIIPIFWCITWAGNSHLPFLSPCAPGSFCIWLSAKSFCTFVPCMMKQIQVSVSFTDMRYFKCFPQKKLGQIAIDRCRGLKKSLLVSSCGFNWHKF